MFENITISEYKRLLDDVIALSHNAEDIGFYPEEKETDILKSKYIIAIYEVLSDVPISRAKWFLKREEIVFELIDEYEDLLHLDTSTNIMTHGSEE